MDTTARAPETGAGSAGPLARTAAIIAFRTYAELRAERERTYLGFLWWVLEPILFMAVFYVAIGEVRGRGGTDFVAFLLVGLVCWQWFRACVSHCGNSIAGSIGLMRQIPLHPVIFPLVAIAADTVKFAFVLVLLVAGLVLLGFPPGPWYAALPLLLVVELAVILAVCLPYAAVVPFVPDIRFVVDNLLLAVMLVSGIFFSLDAVPEAYRQWLMLNPVAILIDDFRRVMLFAQPPGWARELAVAAVALAVAGSSLYVLGRLRWRYTRLPE